MARPRNLLTEWSRLALGVLARGGVDHLVVSPGSRSTPFLWAALREAGLRCHSVIDERAAAFVALGYGRAEGRPAAVLCTSGTAPAHFFPAIIEAHLAQVPLVVLSADRARVDQNVRSPQTIDQTRLFGSFAEYLDLGDPTAERRAFERLARVLGAAIERAKFGAPLHVNLPADKPLEPREAETDEELALVGWVDALLAHRPTTAWGGVRGAGAAVDRVAGSLARSRHPLFALGPMPRAEATPIERLAEALGIPMVGEAGSNAPMASPPESVVGSRGNEVDCIVSFGPPLTSGAFQRFLERSPSEQIIVHGASEGDPTSSARLRIVDRPGAFAEALANHAGRPRPGFEAPHGSNVISRALARLDRPAVSEPGLVLAALRGLPGGYPTLLGNSLSIRLADAVVHGLEGQRPHFQVQRGANGIDGLVAGAQGARIASSSGAAVLLGDVSLAHDLTSLSLFAKLETPLVVLLLDNDGGRLFDHLPMRSEVDDEADWFFFRTPPNVDFESAARAFGVRYETPAPDVVTKVVAESAGRPGVTLVHLRADPRETARFFRELREAYEA